MRYNPSLVPQSPRCVTATMLSTRRPPCNVDRSVDRPSSPTLAARPPPAPRCNHGDDVRTATAAAARRARLRQQQQCRQCSTHTEKETTLQPGPTPQHPRRHVLRQGAWTTRVFFYLFFYGVWRTTVLFWSI